MKKITWLLLFFLVNVIGGLAQSNVKTGVRIGIAKSLKEDINQDLIHNEIFDVEPSRYGGIFAGIYFNSMSRRTFGLKHEIYYTNKGLTYKDTLSNGSLKRLKENLHYVDIYPVNLTANIKNHWQFFGGPIISVFINRRAQYLNSEDKVRIIKESEGVGGEKHLFDFGYNLGLQYEFNSGLNIGSRFNGCLATLKEHSASNSLEGCGNKAILFSLGYTFGRNKVINEIQEEVNSEQ